MYAMMQCRAKSENLAHILVYQIWAVTKLEIYKFGDVQNLEMYNHVLPNVKKKFLETYQHAI